MEVGGRTEIGRLQGGRREKGGMEERLSKERVNGAV
jgi:hypothetical protein